MRVAVVIPCYKVKNKIKNVIEQIDPIVQRIYVIDDKCPENSGKFVSESIVDDRVKVIYHETNLGVGGAVVTGYKQAIADQFDIVVKIDGDGQMDPSIIDVFLAPILEKRYDYAKGNRFYKIEDVQKMPAIRIVGNAVLSFFSKISTGYWHVFDPTNGYTAISVECLKVLDLDKVDKRYFFESDLLFRLSIVGALVKDVPMKAIYEDEKSNLRIKKIIIPFIFGHCLNFYKRVVYDYFLRDFSLASLSLVFSILLLTFGTVFGAYEWIFSIQRDTPATSGTVMLAALPIIIGSQLFLNFLSYDISKSNYKNNASFPLKGFLSGNNI